jgi:release factor glutamine methyltransferase
VEWALAWLKDNPAASVVDVGTGSGAIAIGIAVATEPAVQVTAVDLSLQALCVARANAERIVPARIGFRIADLLDDDCSQYDLIVANLPYLRADQIDGNRDLAAEPRIALDGGQDGLALIARLISLVPDRLAPGGAVALEIDPSQSSKVTALLVKAIPGAPIAVHKDLAGHDRFITAVRI